MTKISRRRRQQAKGNEPPRAVEVRFLFADRMRASETADGLFTSKATTRNRYLPGGKVGVTGNAAGSGVDPVLVEILQLVAEAHVLLRAQQQRRKRDFQAGQRCRKNQRRSQGNSRPSALIPVSSARGGATCGPWLRQTRAPHLCCWRTRWRRPGPRSRRAGGRHTFVPGWCRKEARRHSP